MNNPFASVEIVPPSVIKLVRDGIEPRPGLTITICTSDLVFKSMLMAKLVEEFRELIVSPDRDGFIEELADVAEVIEAIMDHAEVSGDELRRVKDAKKAAKGGFNLRKIAHIGKVDI